MAAGFLVGDALDDVAFARGMWIYFIKNWRV
jgi:hypothetical protein